MRSIGILVWILFLCFVAPSRAQAPSEVQSSNSHRFVPPGPRRPTARNPQLPGWHTGAARLPETARNVIPVTCPAEAQSYGAVCGNIDVPLDWRQPNAGTIPINFEIYAHLAPGPAVSAIFVNFGGPGPGTTPERNSALYLYGANLDTHDLVLIDDRGRGLSGRLVCNELQYGLAPWDQSIADCAAQLGSSASRYGTGAVAQDTEAVRAALGYNWVDYYGGSYGGADVSAYATRFPAHLRSIVLDAPYGALAAAGEAVFLLEKYRTGAETRVVVQDCQNSVLCSADHPSPAAEFDALIAAIRANPIEGDAYDAHGNLVHVLMDENGLLNWVIDNPTGNFASTGEILAAATALSHGDPRPLLRLGAENQFQMVANNGDPSVYSAAAEYASGCVDANQTFEWNTAASTRFLMFNDAIADLPADYFAPFSKSVATGMMFDFFGRRCLYWQSTTPSSPIVAPPANYPSLPTLVLTGEMDYRVPAEEVYEVAAMFPSATVVPVAEAGHETVFWTACAKNLASQFVETLVVGDTTCAKTPETVWPAVGRFPLVAGDARPAVDDGSGQNQIGVAEEKVVSVAVATAVDAMQRSIVGYPNGTGVGLRAGTFSTDYDGGSVWTTTLTNCALATDVFVNGTVAWDVFGSFTAELTVSGPGTRGGTLNVTGTWQAPGLVGNFKVTGTLGGKTVAVLVPEA